MEVFHSKVRETRKRGTGRIAKKIFILITLISFIVACGNNRVKDIEHAIIIVEDANEKSIYSSVNSDNDDQISGEEYAIKNPISIQIPMNTTLEVIFICDTCDHMEKILIDGQKDLLIKCDCPDVRDSNGNIKEYIKIIVSVTE